MLCYCNKQYRINKRNNLICNTHNFLNTPDDQRFTYKYVTNTYIHLMYKQLLIHSIE